MFGFVDFLSTSIQKTEDEGQAKVPDDISSVNLMTIHQSKGMEYKAVFLFNCHKANPVEQVKSKKIIIDKELGILAKLPVNNNYFEDYAAAPIVGVYDYKSYRKTSSGSLHTSDQ